MKILVVGKSHTLAVQEAVNKSGTDISVVHISKVVQRETPGVAFTEKFVRRLDLRETLFSMVGGNAHNQVGLIRHRRPFDFVHPDHADLPLDEGAQILPLEIIRAALQRRAQHWLDALTELNRLAPGRVTHLESPAQIEDQHYMTEYSREVMAGRGITEYTIASPSLRFKLWRLHSAIYLDHCRALGVRFEPVPRASLTPEGFLKREYWANPTHANAAYGSLLIQQMQDLAHAPV